ncbi:transposase [Cucumis melo var. makuwa]|uniref:Transposase n=1 Tax=Cucumis melo var. makuwa TaxID=1194695 RepID=A0A5A7VIN8_CUCMM|nr:transposase [Cucumis melo var. makuwa]
MIEVAHEEYSKDPNGFEKLLIDAKKPFYEGCKKKEFANATECPECGQSRWKNVKDRNEKRKKIPSKVIWYFPPIPRFKRLFRSIECAENLTWHASERIEDGKLRHPADSPAWKLVDFKWPNFGSEPRNLRLALSADGVNPHGTLLDILGKSKDRLNARRDLVDLKLRPELAPISSEKKIFIPHVSTKLEVGNSGVSDNLRWIAHGPHPFVITYSGYAINGCRYHTKSSEKDRSVQNSGVSLVAKTMQVSSSKDKNPVIGDMSFYGVIQEIWDLNYNTLNVSVFKCDWVQNSGGVQIDELGYTLVDLNRVGHNSDSFILASQAKQVFYVEDLSDVRWSVVLTPPQRDFEDRYNDDELGDTILRCEGIPNDMPDVYLNNDLDENVSTYVRSDCEGTWIPT